MILSNRVSKGNTVLYNITSKEDLIKFLNEVIKPKNLWLDISDELNSQLHSIYESTELVTKKQWCIMWSRIHKPYSNTRYEIYWTIRGYSLDEAKSKISAIAKHAGNSFSKRIKENPDQYKSYNPTQIGYWLKKGYTEDEAKALVRERQKTFSLEKCISKWGFNEGTKKFNDRTERWLNSRKESLNNGKWSTKTQTSESNSFKYLKERYKDFWLDEHIKIVKLSSRTTKRYISLLEKLRDSLKTITIEEFFISLSFNEILLYNNTKIKNEFLENISPLELWCKYNGIKVRQNKYGNQYWFNGHYLKSNGEFKIAKYLFDSNILFSANKPYPNDKKCYDFYLNDYDIYVELMGMRDKDYTEKKNNIHKTNFKILWINNIKELKTFINEKNNKIK